ncbi:Zinc finger, CCHC-type [Parasponia andersonii]|uniref:Zinc finger, CCHC-type n=1 Tax=Parasponia andersonii TaxID=3476 RepID=A0A2P5CL99_PARAD|nr:Zinc finger, CCHC-type [Parasponia andersonii]
MATRSDQDIDDDFSEIYKEYTGPLGFNATNTQDVAKTNKRSRAGSDEEEEARDPNAVPTDFTSREAKVWEAKSKATERNWKKRKEEEMICKICGESGHFTQGCPSTLGANRKSQDFFERVPAREKHVKALFTEKVIQKTEKDIGCKIKMDEKFIIVSGKDRLILAKGVDAVRKVIEEGDHRGSSSSHVSRSRSPERSLVGARLQRSDSQRSHSGARSASQFQPRFHRQEKLVEDRIRDNLQRYSRDTSQGRDSIGYVFGVHRKLYLNAAALAYHLFAARAYVSDGARGRSSHSKSPVHPPYMSNTHGSYDGRNQTMGAYRTEGWDSERRGSDMQSGSQYDHPAFPQKLEELEIEFQREAMELGKIRDKEEDEENYKHQEAIREMRENYLKKLAMLRGMHAKQWDDFLQLDAQRRQQQQARQQISPSGYGSYKQQGFSNYDGSSANPRYAGNNLAVESMNRYPNHVENYPSRPHENFGEFQRQRREDYGKAYNNRY